MAFVIRSFPRCGTHMVRTALEQHPDLTVHNEVFNPDFSGLDKIKSLGAEELYKRHTGPREGFVAHGYTREKFGGWEETQKLWREIVPREKPTLIVLHRRDLIRRCFSVYQARATNRWHVWKSQQNRPSLPKVKVQANEVEWQVFVAEQSLDWAKTHYPWAHFFTYEDLVDNWDTQFALMQELLGVEPIKLLPKTDKQDQRPIQEMVSNYRELYDIFMEDLEIGQMFMDAEKNDEQRGV